MLWPHVSQTRNWSSCSATENCVPLWHLMQQTIWTLKLLHNRPSANERKFNNNTKNRSHSQQTTICSPVPWQQPSQRLLGRPQKSSRGKQFYSQVTQMMDAFTKSREGKKNLSFFKRKKSCSLLGKAQKPQPPLLSLGTCRLLQGQSDPLWPGSCFTQSEGRCDDVWFLRLQVNLPGCFESSPSLGLELLHYLVLFLISKVSSFLQVSGSGLLELNPILEGWFHL